MRDPCRREAVRDTDVDQEEDTPIWPSQQSRRERGLPVEQDRSRSSGRGGERVEHERETHESGGGRSH